MKRAFSHSVPRSLRRFLLIGAMALTPLLMCNTARADDTDYPDARLEGYEPTDVVLHDAGDATVWFIFVGLAVLTAGVTFKSANRTHLD
jgi:hypothetical protein